MYVTFGALCSLEHFPLLLASLLYKIIVMRAILALPSCSMGQYILSSVKKQVPMNCEHVNYENEYCLKATGLLSEIARYKWYSDASLLLHETYVHDILNGNYCVGVSS